MEHKHTKIEDTENYFFFANNKISSYALQVFGYISVDLINSFDKHLEKSLFDRINLKEKKSNDRQTEGGRKPVGKMLINLKVKTLDAQTHEFSIDNEVS